MLSFTSPWLLVLSLALVAMAAAAVAVRRQRAPRVSVALVGVGMLLLALAAGGARLSWPQARQVAVMVDASPSTRGAAYRELGHLSRRVRELLGDTPFQVYHFSQHASPASPEQPVAEIPANRTRFSPPADAAAVLLFSDGHFETPEVVPPAYPVIDPALIGPGDARVAELQVRGHEIIASVEHAGPARSLVFDSQTPGEPEPITSSRIVSRAVPPSRQPVAARLDRGDHWPENDALTVVPPPPARLERWWVGTSPPAAAWLALPPAELPEDPAAYPAASVIVLDNVSADALSHAQQQRLAQYVRDLGGALVILGGPDAFAAGGYPGTLIESLSPLSSTPPEPARHWVLLADSSGSMATTVGQQRRWDLAAQALARVIPTLPPNDPVSVGSFAAELRWWTRGEPAGEAAAHARARPGISPGGPTNLQAAMESVLESVRGNMPVELLVLTDAQTTLDVNALAGRMRQARIRLHLLATDDLPADNPVVQLANATGGTMVAQADPTRWADAVRELLRAAAARQLFRADPRDVRFAGPLAAFASSRVSGMNRTWPKDGVTPLAAVEGDDPQTIAAMWNVGAGQVAAMAYAPPPPLADALAALVESEPADPRFVVAWQLGRQLGVTVDGVDADQYLNGLALTLELRADDGFEPQSFAVPQTGPGRYELSVPAPRRPAIATVNLDGRIISRRAVAGRYAEEFESIGANRAALQELADRSGGRVIEPEDTGVIRFEWPTRQRDLAPFLAGGGAIMIAAGLIWWRLR